MGVCLSVVAEADPVRDGRIKVVPRKNVPPLNFNLRAVFIMSKEKTDQRILQTGK